MNATPFRTRRSRSGARGLVAVALAGRRLFGERVGGIAGLGFVSLPGVAVGSLLVSTDTPMLLAFALAMLAWLRLAERGSAVWAAALGAGSGSLGGLVLHLHCHVTDPLHLGIVHGGLVVLAALLAAALVPRVTHPR